MPVRACRCILGRQSEILLMLFKFEKKIAKVLKWEVKFLGRSYCIFKINSATEHIREIHHKIFRLEDTKYSEQPQLYLYTRARQRTENNRKKTLHTLLSPGTPPWSDSNQRELEKSLFLLISIPESLARKCNLHFQREEKLQMENHLRKEKNSLEKKSTHLS